MAFDSVSEGGDALNTTVLTVEMPKRGRAWRRSQERRKLGRRGPGAQRRWDSRSAYNAEGWLLKEERRKAAALQTHVAEAVAEEAALWADFRAEEAALFA